MSGTICLTSIEVELKTKYDQTTSKAILTKVFTSTQMENQYKFPAKAEEELSLASSLCRRSRNLPIEYALHHGRRVRHPLLPCPSASVNRLDHSLLLLLSLFISGLACDIQMDQPKCAGKQTCCRELRLQALSNCWRG